MGASRCVMQWKLPGQMMRVALDSADNDAWLIVECVDGMPERTTEQRLNRIQQVGRSEGSDGHE